jgi:NADH-quinone oxidoreductase subunit L
MGGMRKHMPITRITFMISCLAIAGIFPFAGFFSKDEILAGAWTVNPEGWPGWPSAVYGKILWGALLLAALGTAFYMWRLYFLVFSGNERSETAKHAHESPRTMTMPLVVLAFFATVAGFIGLPHLEKLHVPSIMHGLSSWLAPSVTPNWYMPKVAEAVPIAGHSTDTVTLVLMGVALTIGVVGIAIAYALYGRGPSPKVDKLVDGPLHGAYEASKHKLWFDEIYDVIIVRPFRVVARGLFEVVDRFIIDTVAVNGTAFVVGLFGRLSRWFQNGQVQRYLAGVVIGAALVFFISDCGRKPEFSYKLVGSEYEFHAEPGAGIGGNNAQLRWDLDGNGVPDLDGGGKPVDGTDVKIRSGEVGTYVTLFVLDPVTQKEVKVTKQIREEVQ